MGADSAARWRRLRRLVRGCRICLLLLVLAAVCAFVYLNVAGLPGPLDRALRAELESRGLILDFDTLRLDWNWAVSAEGVRARAARRTGLPEVQVGELLIRVNWWRAVRGRVEITAVEFRDGRVTANLAATNQPPDLLSVEELNGALRFLPGDRWELDSFRGRCLGATLNAFGSVTNALKLPRVLATQQPSKPNTNTAPARPWVERLRPVVGAWREMQFVAPPSIRLRFDGDAGAPETFSADAHVIADGMVAPWGTLRGFDLWINLNDVRTNNLSMARATVTIEQASTPWGQLTGTRAEGRLGFAPGGVAPALAELHFESRNLRQGGFRARTVAVNLRTQPVADGTGRWRSTLESRAGRLDGPRFTVREVAFDTTGTHDLVHWVPEAGRGSLSLTQLDSPAARGATLRATAEFTRHDGPPPPEAVEIPAWLWPWTAAATVEASAVSAGPLQLNSLQTRVQWSDGHLQLTNSVASLPGATAVVEALDADLRARDVWLRAHLRGESTRAVLPWLTESARARVGELRLRDPITLALDARARLPRTLNGETLGSPEFRRSASGTARLQLGRTAWRNFDVDSGELQASYRDRRLEVGLLSLRRPEGALTLSGKLDFDSQEFAGNLESDLLPDAVRATLSRPGASPEPVFEFRAAPVLRAGFQGRGTDLTQLTATGTVACADFAVRGQALQRLSGEVGLTNLFVSARDIAVFHGDAIARADGLGFSVRDQRLYLTNAVSTMPPMLVATAIGTNVVKAIANYRFLEPPQAVVNGSLIVKGRTNHADLRFDLDGGPFEYWRFRLPAVKGTVHWLEDTVTVTNLLGDFYGGRLDFGLHADLVPEGQAVIGFNAVFAEADLRRGLTDLAPGATNLDGTVSGRLTIRSLRTDDWKSWQGNGEARLHNGYLWDLPLFAILTDVVNAIVPGAGKARASAGTGTFVITNSVLHTKDLRIDARPLRLGGRGTVDFDANVNLDIEAEVLPGIPLIGPVFNLAILPVSKALTYRVTGTLGDPHVQPLYVPKFLSSFLNLGRKPKPPKADSPLEPPKP